jgi:primosomal protein N''
MSRITPHLRAAALPLASVLLAACASAPPPPDWQMNARQATDNAVAAYMEGNSRVEAAEFARARGEIARTGRIDLLARAELLRCAARVASLVFEVCEGFEKLRTDAPAAERAYADYLAARLLPQDAAMLPPPHRTVAGTKAEAVAAALRAVDDPLSRLIAAAVLLRTTRATPEVLQLAVESASEQGWRRPLLAWLNVQLMRAEQGGDKAEAERLRRRIAVVQSVQ